MAPLAPIDMPYQPLVRPVWTGSHVRFGLYDQDSSCVGVVRRRSPLMSRIKKRLPESHQRKRRVFFSDSVETREIPHLDDLSNEDVLAAWWTANDYLVIRKMISLTVRMIMNGSKFVEDDGDFCERGLEVRTKAGARARHLMIKQRAIETVLKAQDYQRQEGFSDPEYIAEIYSEYTRDSSEESHFAGLSDEAAAKSVKL
jgi:hypothetical protein